MCVCYVRFSYLKGFSLQFTDFVFCFALDVDGIKFVVNYDYPNSSEDYIHRIGRTGRSTSTGTAYAFVTEKDAKQVNDLISVLKEANQVVNPKLMELAMTGNGFRGKNNRWGGGGGYRRGRENQGARPAHKRFGSCKFLLLT